MQQSMADENRGCPAEHNGCLALGAPTDSDPHPTFTGGKAWTCGRCQRTFSEALPTFYPSGECGRARRGEPIKAVGQNDVAHDTEREAADDD